MKTNNEIVTASTNSASTTLAENGVSRRRLLQKAAGIGAAAAVAALLPGTAQNAIAGGFHITPAKRGGGGPTAGDIAILKFLAVAELVEDDLWSQYTELAFNNPDFSLALKRIDQSLPRYIGQDRDDERSHANLINAYLQSVGEQPINLDPFRTIAPPKVRGIQQVGRLTNLTNLKVDTSWYNRYRGTGNPDLGDTFNDIVTIQNKPTIPLSDNLSNQEMQLIAHAAAFHFCAIEQGGSSLYSGLLSQVTNLDVLAIVASIGPTEFYHFGVFQTSLEGIFSISGNGLNFPNLKGNRPLAEKVMPGPCSFLNRDFPLCSVVRPRDPQNARPSVAAGGLAASGLLTDPDPKHAARNTAFIGAAVQLAQAADAAVRGF